MQSAFYVGSILGGRPLAPFGDRIRLDVANVADGTLRQEESGLPGGHFLAPACPFPQLLRALRRCVRPFPPTLAGSDVRTGISGFANVDKRPPSRPFPKNFPATLSQTRSFSTCTNRKGRTLSPVHNRLCGALSPGG